MAFRFHFLQHALIACVLSAILYSVAGTGLSVKIGDGQFPIAGCPFTVSVKTLKATTTSFSNLTVYVVLKGGAFPGGGAIRVVVDTFVFLGQPWTEIFNLPGTLSTSKQYEIGAILQPGSLSGRSAAFSPKADRLTALLYPGGKTLYPGVKTTLDLFSAAGPLDRTTDLGYRARLVNSKGKVVAASKGFTWIDPNNMFPNTYYQTLTLPGNFAAGTYTLVVSTNKTGTCHAGLSASVSVTVPGRAPYAVKPVKSTPTNGKYTITCQESGLPAYPARANYQVSLCRAADASTCLDNPYSPDYSPLGTEYAITTATPAGTYTCRLFLFDEWSSRVSYDDPHVPPPSYVTLATSAAFSIN